MVRHNRKIESFLKLAIGLVLVVLINSLANNFFFRIDMTEEGRYSISDATKTTLKKLEDVVYIEVYLAGDLNSEFKRFSKSIRETLEEFRVYAGKNIQYSFIDPLQAVSSSAQQEYVNDLISKGIIPTDLFDSEEGKQISRRIFPGALISYQGAELGVMLLKGNKGMSAIEQLNQSMEGVEYELALGIRKLSNFDRKKIALIKDHNELDSIHIQDFLNTMLLSYDVFNVNLASKKSLKGYDAVILSKPTKLFSVWDKYKLDQFIMNGGKAVFLLDRMNVNMDSVSGEGTLAVPYELNLEDQLFKYGVRINADLVQDLNSGAFPVVVGTMGNQPQIRPLPWPYFIMVNSFGKHPVTRNLDAVYLKFASTIDTVRADGIRKTPLLYSSVYSRMLNTPVRVGLNELREVKEENFLNQRSRPLGYLLEGKFTSVFKNRVLPKGVDGDAFMESGVESKVVIIADGDIIRNEVNYRTKEPFDLGFDPVSGATFANSDFLSNLLEYMLNENGIINARNKEIKVRPLDKIKVENQKLTWQILNLGLPLLVIFLFGTVKQWMRKRKYTGN